MANFTKEQIQALAKWEDHFSRAVHSGYSRGVTPAALKEMKEAYDAATHPHSDAILRETCGMCIYNFVREVGELYYASRDALRLEERARKTARAKALRDARRGGAQEDA